MFSISIIRNIVLPPSQSVFDETYLANRINTGLGTTFLKIHWPSTWTLDTVKKSQLHTWRMLESALPQMSTVRYSWILTHFAQEILPPALSLSIFSNKYGTHPLPCSMLSDWFAAVISADCARDSAARARCSIMHNFCWRSAITPELSIKLLVACDSCRSRISRVLSSSARSAMNVSSTWRYSSASDSARSCCILQGPGMLTHGLLPSC